MEHEEEAIKVHYVGGPYDGASEHLYPGHLGLQPYGPVQLAHLTAMFLHVYRCECWGLASEVVLLHVEVRRRPQAVGA
jgi:hypothetical protein